MKRALFARLAVLTEVIELHFPQPFAPGVEGVFRKPALLAELLHRKSAALLLADSLTPLISLRGHLLLRDRLVHEATMQHCPPVGKRGSSDAYVHFGETQTVLARRQVVLDTAYQAHPDRFVRRPPKPMLLPSEVWINKPVPSGENTGEGSQ